MCPSILIKKRVNFYYEVIRLNSTNLICKSASLIELETSKLILNTICAKIKYYEQKIKCIKCKSLFYLSKNDLKTINEYDNIIVNLYRKAEKEIEYISNLKV